MKTTVGALQIYPFHNIVLNSIIFPISTSRDEFVKLLRNNAIFLTLEGTRKIKISAGWRLK